MTRFGWDAHSGVVELDVAGSHGAEEGPTVTHHDGHQAVANLVGQPELEAMTGDGADGDRGMTFAGSGSCLLHRFWRFAGDEGERCVRVDSDPVGGLSLGHDDRHIHGVSPVLAVGDAELLGDWAPAITTAPSSRTKVTSEMA